MSDLRQRLGDLLRTFLWLPAILVAAVAAEYIKPLKDLQRYFAGHPGVEGWSKTLTVAMAVIGGLLLVGTHFVVRVGDERPLSNQNVEERPGWPQRQPGFWGWFAYRFRGKTVGYEFVDEASVREIKGAWRQQAWLTNPRWRRMYLMMAGGICMVLGLFGFFFVVGPPLVKLLCGGALLFASARTVWTFWRA